MSGLTAVLASAAPFQLRRIPFVPARKSDVVALPEGLNLVVLNEPQEISEEDAMRRDVLRKPGMPNSAAHKPTTRQAAAKAQDELALRWRTVHKMGAGLQNLGNTCYMNAVLQCLTHTPPLAEALLAGGSRSAVAVRSGISRGGADALALMAAHIERSLRHRSGVLSPVAHVRTLRSVSKSFQRGRQEDAHEYLVALLDAMHVVALGGPGVKAPPNVAANSLIYRIFAGRMRSQVKCMECGYESNTYDPFLDVSLEINRASSVTRALQRFTAAEYLEGNNKYKCPSQRKMVRAAKRMTIEHTVSDVQTAPAVLVVQLKRFEFSARSRAKISKRVDFEPTLDLAPFMSERRGPPRPYTLFGVLVHHGHSLHAGHYVSFVRGPNGLWHMMDDASVSQVSERMVLGQKAYILFYIRDEPSTPSAAATAATTPSAASPPTTPRRSRELPSLTANGLSAVLPNGPLPNGIAHEKAALKAARKAAAAMPAAGSAPAEAAQDTALAVLRASHRHNADAPMSVNGVTETTAMSVLKSAKRRLATDAAAASPAALPAVKRQKATDSSTQAGEAEGGQAAASAPPAIVGGANAKSSPPARQLRNGKVLRRMRSLTLLSTPPGRSARRWEQHLAAAKAQVAMLAGRSASRDLSPSLAAATSPAVPTRCSTANGNAAAQKRSSSRLAAATSPASVQPAPASPAATAAAQPRSGAAAAQSMQHGRQPEEASSASIPESSDLSSGGGSSGGDDSISGSSREAITSGSDSPAVEAPPWPPLGGAAAPSQQPSPQQQQQLGSRKRSFGQQHADGGGNAGGAISLAPAATQLHTASGAEAVARLTGDGQLGFGAAAPRWQDVDGGVAADADILLRESAPSQREADDYDAEYDRGRTKKVRRRENIASLADSFQSTWAERKRQQNRSQSSRRGGDRGDRGGGRGGRPSFGGGRHSGGRHGGRGGGRGRGRGGGRGRR